MNQIPSQKHIPILDGIRAYAVLMVCVFHFFQINEASLYEHYKVAGITLFKISQIGVKGVELFFLLSGFLITGILLDSKKSHSYFKTFYARRFLRIFPLYYFVLLVSFGILPRLYEVDAAGQAVIKNQAWLWGYLSNLTWYFHPVSWNSSLNFPWFEHFWSLCVEEHFYIFWPLIIYFTAEKHLPIVMTGIMVLSAISVIFKNLLPGAAPILNWSTLQSAGILSLGGMVAFYYKTWNVTPETILRLRKLLLPAFSLFLFIHLIPRSFRLYEMLTFFIPIIFFALVLINSLYDQHITQLLFNHKSLYFIGKISYGIYVYHGLLRPFFYAYLYCHLVQFIQPGIIASLIYTVLCTTISIGIAWMSWGLFESKILKLKNKFSY